MSGQTPKGDAVVKRGGYRRCAALSGSVQWTAVRSQWSQLLLGALSTPHDHDLAWLLSF